MTKLNLLLLDIVRNQPFDLNVDFMPIFMRQSIGAFGRHDFYESRGVILSSTLRLHGTGGTGRIFEQLSVQVWDLKKAGQLFDRHGSIFVRTRVNTRSVQLFAQIARLWAGIKCRNWSKLCMDPCKHHCNRICTDPCPGTKFVCAKVCPDPCKRRLNEYAGRHNFLFSHLTIRL